MTYCKKCMWYKEEYDEMRQTGDDINPKENTHYCIMYEKQIPQGIADDKDECPYHIDAGGDNGGN